MKKQFTKRILSWFLAGVMALGIVAPVGAVPAVNGGAEKKVAFEKVDNSAVTARLGERIAEEEADTQDIAADTRVRVSILLEDDATIAKYSTDEIAQNGAAMRYRASLAQMQETMENRINQVISGKLEVVWNLTLAANIISANVNYGDIAAIEKVPGVAAVVLETRYEPMVIDREEAADPNMSTSGKMTGAYNAYAAGYTGAGMRIAIIDTGTDTDHQSFDEDAFLYSLEKGEDKGAFTIDSLDLLDKEEIANVLDALNIASTGVTADDLYLTAKLPFAYNYVDRSLEVTHDNDEEGEHGSHVAGIATANAYIPASDGYEPALETVKVQGAAPDAQLITMKVFGESGGAYDSDYMAAIEDAVVLGCDSVNLSLGSSYPGFSKSIDAAAANLYNGIMEALEDSGTVVTISAGNSGSWAENAAPIGYLYAEDISMQTDGSPGSFDNAFTVASADNIGYTGMYVTAGDTMIFYYPSKGTLATLTGEQEYVYVDGLGYEAEFEAAGVEGKIAICNRGTLDFAKKAQNAYDAGAIGIIVVNSASGMFGMALDAYTGDAPVVGISQEYGKVLRDNADRSVQIDAGDTTPTVYYGKLTPAADTGVLESDAPVEMSEFSSWGVPGSLTLKPEITAPGGSIYSVNGAVAGGKAYENMSGTSMAAPQIAGISALVAQYIEENHLVEKTGLTKRALTQSLLMSTAKPLWDESEYSNGCYYPVLQQGAGHVDAGAAVSAQSYILMDKSATDSAKDGKVKAELGDDPDRTGSYTVAFTVNNLTDEALDYALSANLFTQDLFSYDENGDGADELYMDTATIPLTANVKWLVDGETPAAPKDELKGMDFDGNGVVDEADADAMLAYIVGSRDSLHDIENADLDEDGDIDSYDVYLFLAKLHAGAVTVPANGSVSVEATITISDAYKAYLNQYYTNGAYVEGYIYVRALTTDEGVIGVTHSIPVLGFYGDWSDPSMYEHGQLITYYTGEDPYTPYLGKYITNYLQVQYAGESEAYAFTGNPVFFDSKYMPERNAINSQDVLTKWSFGLIRNAALLRIDATNGNDEPLFTISDENVVSAFYSSNSDRWLNTLLSGGLNFQPAKYGLEEDDTFTLTLTAATEYSVDKYGNQVWNNLGKGASQEFFFTVDDTAPVVDADGIATMKDAKDNSYLKVTASDNRYIAAIVLYNPSGTKALTYTRGGASDELGGTYNYYLPLSGVNGSKFYLQVIDYAYNVTTYRLDMKIGEQVKPEAIVMNGKTAYSLAFADGKTKLADAKAITTFADAPCALEEVKGALIASYPNGDLKVLNLEDPADVKFIANVGVAFQDLAYVKNSDTLYGVVYKTAGDANSWLGGIYEIDYLNGKAEQFFPATNVCALGADDTILYYITKINDIRYDVYTMVFSNRGHNSYTKGYFIINENNTKLSLDCKEDTPYVLSVSDTATALWQPQFPTDTYEKITLDKVSTDEDTYKASLGCLVFPDNNATTDWMDDETSDATRVTVDPAKITIFRGSSTQLSATVMPWNLTDRSVTWTSSDDSIVSVSADGTITGLNETTTPITITATSTRTSNVVGRCEVTVVSVPVYLAGALQDEEGESYFFDWNMKEDFTWTKGTAISPSIGAITSDGAYVYVLDGDSTSQTITQIELGTGEKVETFTSKTGAPYWDMAYSQLDSEVNGEARFLSVYAYYIMIHGTDPTVLGYYDMSTALTQKGAAAFIGIASSGVCTNVKYNTISFNAEVFFAVDNGGNVWLLYYGYDESGAPQLVYSVIATDLPADAIDLSQYIYNSLVCDPISSVLYLSAYNSADDTSNLYLIALVQAGKTLYGSTVQIGSVGAGVWPAALYEAVMDISENYPIDLYGGAESDLFTLVSDNVSAGKAVALSAEEWTPVAVEMPVSGQSAKSASPKFAGETYDEMLRSIASGSGSLSFGGLNAYNGSVRPNSTVVVDKDDENRVVLRLTAKDADGNDIASTNGKSIVSYDPTALRLVSVNSVAAHYAYNDENGEITFAYADLAAIEAGNPVAVFVFERVSDKDADLKIDYKEVNDEKIGASEDITDICQHERTIIKNAVPATPFRPGYTGDKYCAICGKLLARGEYLPILVGPSYPTNPADDIPKADEKPVEPKPAEEPASEPSAPAVSEKELPFVDVQKDYWFYEDVLYVYENGLMNGVSDTEFAPNETLTRAMVVTILSRMSGEEIEEAAEAAFSDVAAGMWYSNAIAWAAEKNIVNGFEDGTFQPDAPVTRAQLVTILYRYAQYKGMDTSTLSDLAQFTDAADVPAYALEAMQWAVGSGLLSGNGLMIDASANATRAQVAAIIHRFLTK